MHFSLETDYAVRMIAALADGLQGGTDYMCAASLGKAACVPKPTALKVLRILKDRGLIISGAGVNGGYRLARSPSEITLCEVVEALEGKLEISRCLSGCYECSRTGKEHESCKFHCIFRDLNGKLYESLSSITFEGKNL